MSFALLGSMGETIASTTGSGVVLTTTTTNAPAGTLVIVAVNMPPSAVDGISMQVLSVSDSGGNGWTRLAEYNNASGRAISLWMSRLSTALNIGGTITAAHASMALDRLIHAHAFSTAAQTLCVQDGAAVTGLGDATDLQSLAISGLLNVEHLFLRASAANDSYTVTPTTSWTEDADYSGGKSLPLHLEHYIATATSATSDPTATNTSRHHASVLVAIREAPVIAALFAAPPI